MIGKRIELDGRNVERGGQQFVSGRGLFKDGYTDVHRIEPHGFSSQPVKGAKAFLIAPNGPDQAYVVGGEHPSHRPNNIPGGGSALYDAHGNIIRMVMGMAYGSMLQAMPTRSERAEFPSKSRVTASMLMVAI